MVLSSSEINAAELRRSPVKAHSDVNVGLEVLQITVVLPGSVNWTHLNTETKQIVNIH